MMKAFVIRKKIVLESIYMQNIWIFFKVGGLLKAKDKARL